MDLIIKDIDAKLDSQQYAARKGVGTEHLLVAMMDRILGQLDKPGMSAVIRAAADWAAAFDQTGTRLVTGEADNTIKIWKEDDEATPETHPIDMKAWTKQCRSQKRF